MEEEEVKELKLFDRELSWLSFNERVLQEAKDDRVPLIERLRFLAIYSSNLDEFFRVRVASVKSLISLKKKTKKQLEFSPKKLLKVIHDIVDRQQQEFGRIFRKEILPALKEQGIHILKNEELNKSQVKFVRAYFQSELAENLEFDLIEEGESEAPFLENRLIYLAVRFSDKQSSKIALIRVPDQANRFLVVPDDEGRHVVVLLEDVLRLSLDRIFPKREVECCHSFKLSRDAELYIEDEFSGDLVEKIHKSLNRRSTGLPSRFLYDQAMPEDFLKELQKAFEIDDEDTIAGGRYHNFYDYFGFPVPDNPELVFPLLKPAPHPDLDRYESIFDAIRAGDKILHFPYQSYDYVLRLLEEAADDPDVRSIKITLYRVAGDSKVAKALIKAAENGKKVEVFDEVKARFDEQSNIFWGKELEAAGARVRYSYPGLKVHTKICLIKRKENGENVRYGYFGTGNFNEKTARIYCDHALLTCDPDMAKEVDHVFAFLMDFKFPSGKFNDLLVAPFQMRIRFLEMIDREIAREKSGGKGYICAKMNSLEDQEMIAKLYEASQEGVEVKLIIRGICKLIPGIPGLSENIEIKSLVGRFLEHARVYVFGRGDEQEMYVASADWMNRNLSKRVEVGFRIKDDAIREELYHIIDLQWKDNTKARIINTAQDNPYVDANGNDPIDAQSDTYQFLLDKASVASEA